jgi:hypothetical protein
VKIYENYGRKESWMVIRFGKYGRKIITIQLGFLPYFPYNDNFLPYFPYHFTIFSNIFHIISLFNLLFFCISKIFSLFDLGLKIWKLWKKGKLNSEMIWKIWKKSKLNSEKRWKIQRKSKLNSEKIGKWVLFSLSASYNLINFYELAFSLVICPFPAILFS